MNIYGLYARNSNRAGFWVQHRTWNNICLYVERIDGKESGRIGKNIAMKNRSRVEARAFDVRSGRPLLPAAYGFDPDDRGFVSIAEPAWSHPALRPQRTSGHAFPGQTVHR